MKDFVPFDLLAEENGESTIKDPSQLYIAICP